MVLPEQQATTVAGRILAATPSVVPTRTPIPTLESLVLANSIGSGDAPQGEIENAPSSGTVYAAALIHDLTKGAVVTGVWTTADGSEVSRQDVDVDASVDERWVAFRLDLNESLPPGAYAVYVYVDGTLLNSLVFRIG